jgi:hypothetical protein
MRMARQYDKRKYPLFGEGRVMLNACYKTVRKLRNREAYGSGSFTIIGRYVFKN